MSNYFKPFGFLHQELGAKTSKQQGKGKKGELFSIHWVLVQSPGAPENNPTLMKFTVFHASLQSLILSFLHPISQTNKAHFLRFLAFVIKAHGLNGCPFLYWYRDTKIYVITHLSSVWFPLSHCVYVTV